MYYDFADITLSNWTYMEGRKTVIHTAVRETQTIFLITTNAVRNIYGCQTP